MERGSYFTEKRSGRSLAVWDFDNDGDMDAIISHLDRKGVPSLLRNDGGNGNHWLGLTLTGKNGEAFSAGAQVTVTAGGKKQVLVNQWGTTYLANNDPRMHIGLGIAKMIDLLEITWPDGSKEGYNNIETDRYITIKEGEGIVE